MRNTLPSSDCVRRRVQVQCLMWHPTEPGGLLTAGFDRQVCALDVRQNSNPVPRGRQGRACRKEPSGCRRGARCLGRQECSRHSGTLRGVNVIPFGRSVACLGHFSVRSGGALYTLGETSYFWSFCYPEEGGDQQKALDGIAWHRSPLAWRCR